MSRSPSVISARVLAVAVFLYAASLPGTVPASAVSSVRHKAATTTYTAYAFSSRAYEPTPADPDCHGSLDTAITITGRAPNWHLSLHQLDYLACAPNDYTTDADEDLEPGEFWMSPALKRAVLNADVTLQFGCCEGGTARAHISAVWSGNGVVTTTVSTETEAGQRTRMLTKTRPAAFRTTSTSTFTWPSDEPPTAYLQRTRVLGP